MKKILQWLFRFKKEVKAETDFSSSDLSASLEKETFPCRACNHLFDFGQSVPLSVTSCSKCGEENFVPKKLGPFWLYRFCGDGGMGRVYQAICSLVPGTEFAVKVLNENNRLNSEMVEGLRRESEITSFFNEHPNSVKTVEFDHDEDIYYMAMEYIDGFTIDQIIEQKGKFTEKETVKYILDLLSIIEYIYSKGYLYRDLKPQNAMINEADELILLDYGICLPKDAAVDDSFEDVEGSPHFLPPERLTGEGEDIRSEIYSIGMLMFYMLTGETYFKGNDIQEIAEMHVTAERRENLADELPHISEELVRLIDKMTRQKKRRRAQDLGEVKAVLNCLWRQHTVKKKELELQES